MSVQRIRLFFFLGILAITLNFSILFARDCCRYFSLNTESAARITQWEITPKKGRFALKAEYVFEAQGKTWQGSSILNPPYYLNEGAAFTALKRRAKEPWAAVFQEKNPAVSSLENEFPKNLLFRSLISLGVLVYFLLYPKLLPRTAPY